MKRQRAMAGVPVVEKVPIKIYVTVEEYAQMKKLAVAREWTIPHVIRYAIRELLK